MRVKNKKPTTSKALYVRMAVDDLKEFNRLREIKGYSTNKNFIIAVLGQMQAEERAKAGGVRAPKVKVKKKAKAKRKK